MYSCVFLNVLLIVYDEDKTHWIMEKMMIKHTGLFKTQSWEYGDKTHGYERKKHVVDEATYKTIIKHQCA